MAIKQVTKETYDSTGLISTEIIEVEVLDINEEIQLKEAELLKVYADIERLKQLNDTQS